jgi:hypothetical protein
VNSWANLTAEFEEGGYKSSGVGRLGGLASIEDFLEYKQITQDYVPVVPDRPQSRVSASTAFWTSLRNLLMKPSTELRL